MNKNENEFEWIGCMTFLSEMILVLASAFYLTTSVAAVENVVEFLPAQKNSVFVGNQA